MIDGEFRIVSSNILVVVLVLTAAEGVVAGAVVVVVSKTVLTCSKASIIVQLGLSLRL